MRVTLRKNILLIATGGTIASTTTSSGLSPLLTSEDVLQYIKNIDRFCEVDSIQLCNLDSTNIGPEHWIMMAETIHKSYDKYDGFVITHGTDTMAYTAAALSYLIQHSPKPIIITGSQKPINTEDSDSRMNLYGSFLYASSELASGVQIMFGGKVILGTRARKTHSKSFHAFSSINYPYLAVVQEDKILQYISQTKEKEPVFYNKLNPRVSLLKLVPGMESNVLDFLLENNDAVIIESFGVGGIPSLKEYNYYEVIEKWTQHGKTIVMTTQVPNEGSDMNVYKVGQKLKKQFPILEAYDMTTEAVVTKLMWILGQTQDQEEIDRLFYTTISNDLLYNE